MNRLQGYAGSKLDRPGVLFTAPKAIIEALNNIPEGSIAYATDTDEIGTYDGSSWTWGGGGGGSGDMLKSVYDVDDNGFVDDSESTQSLQGAGIDPALLSLLADGDLLRWNEDDLQFESQPFPATGDVNGPGGATVGNVAVFSLSTGKQITDIGIPLGGGPQGFGLNYVITPSVTSNNLTLALKTLDGSDPSLTKKIITRIGNTPREITGALSLTINASVNTFNAGSSELAAKDIDYFCYAGWRVSDESVFALISRMPWGRTYADFSSTATNEKYGAYSGSAPASTDVVELIGRFRARLSAGASYNWSIPNPLVINRPIFETDWLTWAPTHTRAGTNYTNPPTTLVADYKVDGRAVQLVEAHQQHATPGGAGVQQMTLPWTNVTTRATQISASNNTAGTQFIMYVIQSAARGDYYKYDGNAEAIANNIYGCGVGEYRIA